jgi:hypothetical protein
MTRTIIFALFSLTISGTSLAQGLFEDCSKNVFRPSKPQSWQRDTTQSRTFVRNCHASTTYLVLYNDSTFQFKVDRCGTGGYNEGKWRKDLRERIVLNNCMAFEPKLVSVHNNDPSMTYMIEKVDNYTFKIREMNLVKVVR